MRIRKTIRKVLREGIKEKMIELIDEYGLMSAINFVGGWDDLKKRLGEYHLTTKDMIGFIKELVKEPYGLSVFDFNKDPIYYNQTNTEYREIHFFGINTVVVQVWEKENFEDLGTFNVPYENLDDATIMEIFELLLEEYEKGIDI
jgi:hydroxymethylpyrimidine pyrophosphatase-like HAD family hydrolase